MCGLVHCGALWQQIGGSAQVCSVHIRHSTSSELGQHFVWVAAPVSAMEQQLLIARAVWVPPTQQTVGSLELGLWTLWQHTFVAWQMAS